MKKLFVTIAILFTLSNVNAQTTKSQLTNYKFIFVELKVVKVYNHDRLIGQCKIDDVLNLIAADSVKDYVYYPVVFNNKKNLKGTINIIDGNQK